MLAGGVPAGGTYGLGYGQRLQASGDSPGYAASATRGVLRYCVCRETVSAAVASRLMHDRARDRTAGSLVHLTCGASGLAARGSEWLGGLEQLDLVLGGQHQSDRLVIPVDV